MTKVAEWSSVDVSPYSCLRDLETLGIINADFGHLTAGNAYGVVTPASAKALQTLVQMAYQSGLPITIRGAGMSQSGQSIGVHHSLVINTSGLNKIEPVNLDTKTIRVQAGARWGDVMTSTLQQGFIPFVSSLNVDMSVGGLLSVGGLGASSHHYGPLINHVTSLDVITGTGESLHCSRAEQAELFDAVLGGAGRYAIITHATLALRPSKPFVKTFYLLYDNLEKCLMDQRKMIDEKRGDYLEVMCSASLQGLRNTDKGRRPFAEWLYPLHLSFEYDKTPIAEKAALKDLQYWRYTHREDNTSENFVTRYQPRFDMMRATGSMELAHPWLECLLPDAVLPTLLPDILRDLPLWLGDMHRLFFVAKPISKNSAFKVPESERVVAFAILPMGVPSYFQAQALEVLTQIHHRLIAAGGKRYMSGWLGMMKPEDWALHYGEDYARLLALKDRFDPRHVLTSALFER